VSDAAVVTLAQLSLQLDEDFVQHIGTPAGMSHEDAADLAGVEAAKALRELADLFNDAGTCDAETIRARGSRMLALATALLECAREAERAQ
jgi:hypothetical protein